MNTLNLKFTTLSLLAVLTLAVFMTSCEQDAVEVQTLEIDNQEILTQRAKLAKHLSIMIAEQPDFNQKLKAMSLAERENGYYEREFFFNIEKDKVSELFDGSSLDATLATSLDNGFDDSDPTSQIQYYENGVFGAHSISEVPEVLTFIVRKSEAYLSPEALAFENPADITKIGTIAGNDINVFGYNSSTTSTIEEAIPTEYQNEIESRSCPYCPRNSYGGKENLYSFVTTNDHDGGWNGAGEFIFDILFADNGSGITSLRARYTGVNANSWVTTNRPIITWTSTNDLDRMKYRIMEDDAGATYTLGLSLSGQMNGVTVSGSVQVAYTDDDDFVGETIVEYCDNIRNCGTYYEYAGSVQMALYQL